MNITLVTSVIFALLVAQASTIKIDGAVDSEERPTEFYGDEKEGPKKISMSEMPGSLKHLLNQMNQKFAISDSKLELMEKSIANLTEILKDKVAPVVCVQPSPLQLAILVAFAQTNFMIFQAEFVRIKGRPTLFAGRIHLCDRSSLLGFPIGVPLKEINGDVRTILIAKDTNATSANRIYRKYWLLHEESVITSFRFTILNSNLGPNDQLTLTGISTFGGTNEETPFVESTTEGWNRKWGPLTTRRPTSPEAQISEFRINSQTPNSTEFTIKGFLAVVTLKLFSENTGKFYPGFVLLGYKTEDSGIETHISHRSQIISKDGFHEVSLPEGNKEYYDTYTSIAILIAPQSGAEFKMTLKYLDVEHHDCDDCACDYLKVFSLDGNYTHSSSPVKMRPDPTKRYCGNLGVTSKILGFSSAALLFFRSDDSYTGKGFKVEIQPQV